MNNFDDIYNSMSNDIAKETPSDIQRNVLNAIAKKRRSNIFNKTRITLGAAATIAIIITVFQFSNNKSSITANDIENVEIAFGKIANALNSEDYTNNYTIVFEDDNMTIIIDKEEDQTEIE